MNIALADPRVHHCPHLPRIPLHDVNCSNESHQILRGSLPLHVHLQELQTWVWVEVTFQVSVNVRRKIEITSIPRVLHFLFLINFKVFNSLPNNKIDWSKFKEFADDNHNSQNEICAWKDSKH